MCGPPACKLARPLCCPGPSAVCRFVFFAFPLLRKARGIQKVLDDAPQPGARGLVKDMLKLAWGEAAGFVSCAGGAVLVAAVRALSMACCVRCAAAAAASMRLARLP